MKKRILTILIAIAMVINMTSYAVMTSGAVTNVASVTVGDTTTNYTTLADAVAAVADCTASDNAKITILADIDQGDSYQEISSGVFTIDLNGKEISTACSEAGIGALTITGGTVTIMDSATGGKVTGGTNGVRVDNADLTVTGGTFTGVETGLITFSGTLEITGGTFTSTANYGQGISSNDTTVTISGGTFRAFCYGADLAGGSVTISGGEFIGDNNSSSGIGLMIPSSLTYGTSELTVTGGTFYGLIYGMSLSGCTASISGADISGSNGVVIYSSLVPDGWEGYGYTDAYANITISNSTVDGYIDFVFQDSVSKLTLGANTSFTDGIIVSDGFLADILGEGMAYYQNGSAVTLTEGQTEITDGDVTVKAASAPTAPTGVLLEVTKEFTDWDKAESFTFILEPVTAGAPMPASTTAIASEDMPLASFGMITFEAEGTYEYTITEVDDGIDGITYDKTEHAVVVTVTKGADNSLTAVVTYDGEDSLTITNTYTKPVRITAVDAADGSVLDGVTVQIANARGTIIYEWTTTAEAHEIFGLNVGETYNIYTAYVPGGYTIPGTVLFSFDNQGDVDYCSGTLSDDGVILIEVENTEVSVAAVDADNGLELAGATVQIIDSEGYVVEQWVSGTEAHKIAGLNIGEAYSVRIFVAPDGYDIPFDTTFALNEDGNVASTGSVTEDGVILVVLDKTPAPTAPTSGDDFTGASCLLFSCDNSEHGTFVADCFFEGYSRAGTVREENGEFFCDITWNVRAYWEAASLSLVEYYGVHTSDTTLPETKTFEAKWDPALGKWVYEEAETYGISCQNTTPVASVTVGGNTTNYTDLEEAFEAASGASGSTLTLLDNIVRDTAITVESGNFTVDLNGKTWECTDNTVIRLLNDSKLKIDDSSADKTGKLLVSYISMPTISMRDNAELEIAGGTVEHTYGVEVVDMSSSGNMTSAKLLVSGGKLITNGNTVINAFGSSITVTGGVLEHDDSYGSRHIYYHTGTVDLSGYSDPSGIVIWNDHVSGDVTLGEDTIKLPTGYVMFDDSGNVQTTLVNGNFYEVGKAPAAVDPVTVIDPENGTVTYTPADAKEGDKVTLVITPDEGYEIDKVTVTDKDGNPVPFDEDNSFVVPSGGATVETTFKKTVYATKTELDEAIADIEKAITDLKLADTDNAKALADAIDTLNKAIEAAEAAALAGDSALAGKIAEAVTKAETDLAAAVKRLEALVSGVQSNLDKVKNDLDKAIRDLALSMANGNTNISAEIAKVNDALAKAQAALEKADADNKAELINRINTAEATLKAAVDKVQKDLENAKNDLQQAINNGDKNLDDKIIALNKALVAAEAALKETDAANKTALEAALASAELTLKTAIDKVQANLDNLQSNLENRIKALELAMYQNDHALENQIISLNSALTLAKLQLEQADAENKEYLESKIDEAEKLIDEAIKSLQSELANAKSELENAIAAGDSALDADITVLNNSLISTRAALEAADEANKAELLQEIESAEHALEAAIEAVQNNLDDAKAELSDAIASGDSALGEKIELLSSALEAAKAALEQSDAENKTELENAIASAQTALEAAIDEVASDLEEAQKELAAAIADGDTALSDRISALNTALDNAISAYQAADGALKTELTSKIEAADVALDASVKAVQKNLDDAKAALEKAIKNGDSALSGKIDALNKALEDAITASEKANGSLKSELNAKIDEATAALDASVKAVQKNLDDAKAALNKAISDGDSALDSKIAELSEAFAAAKAALEAADTANKTELTDKMNEAYTSLDAAVKAVQQKLDDLKSALEQADSDNKAALEEKNNALAAKDDELAAKDDELTAKDSELTTILIIVSAVSGATLCGGGAFVVWFFIDRKKRIIK